MKKLLLYIISTLITFFLFTIKIYSISNITIKEGTLIPYFNNKIYNYNVFLDENIEYINLNVTKDNTDDYIIGNGKIQLKKGLNELVIEVKKLDGNIIKYYINVNRGYKEQKDLKSATLKSLEIVGHTIEFNPEIFEYSINLSEDENELIINYIPMSEYSKVVLEGNNNLNLNKNIISLTVTSNDEKTSNTYIIQANKVISVAKEETKEKKDVKINENQRKIMTILIFLIGFIIIIVLFKVLFFKKKKKII